MTEKIKYKIKEKLFSFYTYRLFNKYKRKQVTLTFDNAKNVGVLCSFSDIASHKVVMNFVSKLRKIGKNIDIICYLKESDIEYNYSYPSFNYNDFSFSGKVLDNNVLRFINKDFDFLYFLDFNMLPIFEYILAKSKAVCKAGYFFQSKRNSLDIMVNFNKHTDKILSNKTLKNELINNEKKSIDLENKKYNDMYSKDLLNLTEMLFAYTEILK